VIDPGTVLDIDGIGECLCLDHDCSRIDVLGRDGHTYLTTGPDGRREPHEAMVTPELTRGHREYLRGKITCGNFSPKREAELLASVEAWFEAITDKDRLDWLISREYGIARPDNGLPCWRVIGEGDREIARGGNLRKTIDQAMASEKIDAIHRERDEYAADRD
jgi:hypothetical protein